MNKKNDNNNYITNCNHSLVTDENGELLYDEGNKILIQRNSGKFFAFLHVICYSQAVYFA